MHLGTDELIAIIAFESNGLGADAPLTTPTFDSNGLGTRHSGCVSSEAARMSGGGGVGAARGVSTAAIV